MQGFETDEAAVDRTINTKNKIKQVHFFLKKKSTVRVEIFVKISSLKVVTYILANLQSRGGFPLFCYDNRNGNGKQQIIEFDWLMPVPVSFLFHFPPKLTEFN